MTRPFVLVVCDGWGHSDDILGNAIAQANTPVVDALTEKWPHTLVDASGEAVGLPPGQQGNSEVGHLTIGAGRIIKQPLARINTAVSDGTLDDNAVLRAAMDRVVSTGGALHLLGLVSPGGVHSHQDHGVAVAEMARHRGVERVHAHVFTDGRDEPPRSAAGFVERFIEELQGVATVATLSGRYYAMDRDSRWDRTERTYRALMGEGPKSTLSPLGYIEDSYSRDISDEFIEPVRFTESVRIEPGDGVIFWNFRPDRARQLSHALVDEEFTGFERGSRVPDLDLVSFTLYDSDLVAEIAFPRENIAGTIAEVVSAASFTQFHVAETEKYAHVTYFINGGREDAFPGEERLLIPSPRVATYDTAPEMSAVAITDAVVDHLNNSDDTLIIVNFANPDMVGHTGDLAATIAAVEVVDTCLGRINDAVTAKGGAMLITADHGNAEHKIDPRDGSPLTAHTTNKVPVILCGAGDTPMRDGGGLQDVGPTVLAAMDLPIPAAMTGSPLNR